MKILVAGASCVIGRHLVPKLVAAGHDVAGTTRTPSKEAELRGLEATPFVVDVLDPDAVGRAVAAFEPEIIVHQATALSSVDMRHFERSFALTNRLRTEGTDHLLAAGRAVGVRKFVAQSFAGWPFARSGGPVKTEDDPLDPSPPAAMRSTLEAIRRLESRVGGAEGIEGLVLRYGGFYGPGTSIAEGAEHWEAVRRRRFPIIGRGTGIWSFIHIDDVAAATMAAIERGVGVYNVVDDDPAPVSEWLPALAAAVGARPPRRFPAWLGRLAAGEHTVVMMNEIRGASNEKAKRELGLELSYPTWREGFKTLSASRASA